MTVWDEGVLSAASGRAAARPAPRGGSVGTALPGWVVVPAHPHPDGLGSVSLELGGDGAALAFSSVEGLVAALGHHQPWIQLSAPALDHALREAGVGRVRLDPSGTSPRWTSDAVQTLTGVLDGRV